jgi:polyhydroxyalkanoate synthesis regulator protein|tara:strand:- start:74 stop:283 length:210 start_codon:yes stop_codon:yes gene_type:complete
MIKVQFKNGQQIIKKICNHCGCDISDLEIEDIMVKKPSDMRVYDKNGNEITRTKLPTELTDCKCEMCND